MVKDNFGLFKGYRCSDKVVPKAQLELPRVVFNAKLGHIPIPFKVTIVFGPRYVLMKAMC